MNRLSLTLFGTFAASISNHTLHLPTDKSRALLAYLALTPPAPLRRETLAGLLWPEQSEARARQNLRQTAARLRRVIADHDPQLAGSLLSLTRQTMKLHAEHCDADVVAFRDHLAAARNHTHTSFDHCSDCLAQLQAATALYRRGDLLAGFSLPDAAPFEEWLRLQRENLYQQQLEALHTLTLAYERQGLLDEARRTALWQIQQEPWHEEAHRQLMRLLATAGQRAAAIAQYQSCRQILQDELGVAPSPETEALLAEIMAGSLPVVVSSTAAPRPQPWPEPAGPLIGRDIELAEILLLLAEPACRLLTMSGPGGIGKTSLALSVGQKLLDELPSWFAGGVYYVPLAELTNASQLPGAVAASLGIELNQRRSIASQVEQFLRPRALLLILDNAEHLAADAGWLRDLIAASSRLKCLVTSREPLNWQGEWRYPLEGLAYPQDSVEGGHFGAVQLFVQAARRVEPGFVYTSANGPDIIRICQLVYGWPLALRMAAAWVRMMSCAAIADQIAGSLDFLTSSLHDVPPRQRSMRAIFDHSWDSLSPQEQGLLQRLAVFRGGFTLAAVTGALAASPLLLRSLVDKALVQVEPDGDRYQLHELLRHFALEKAAADPQAHAQAQQSHGRYFLALLQTQGDRLHSGDSQAARSLLRADFDNLRRAWFWAIDNREVQLLSASLDALDRYFASVGPPQEAVAFYRRTVAALEEQGPGKPLELIAHVLYHISGRLLLMGQYAAAQETTASAQSIARSLGAISLSSLLDVMQAHIHREQGRYDQARAILQDAIADSRTNGSLEGEARALHSLGNTFWSMAEYNRARACYEQGRRLYEQLGLSLAASTLTGNIGVVHWRLGQHQDALAHYRVALEATRITGDIARTAIWLGNIGLVYVDLADDEQALAYIDEALQTHDQLGRNYYKIELLLGKVALFLRRGETETAARYLQQATELSYLLGNPTYLHDCDLWQARLHIAQQRAAEAATLLNSLATREFRPDVSDAIARELQQLDC